MSISHYATAHFFARWNRVTPAPAPSAFASRDPYWGCGAGVSLQHRAGFRCGKSAPGRVTGARNKRYRESTAAQKLDARYLRLQLRATKKSPAKPGSW